MGLNRAAVLDGATSGGRRIALAVVLCLLGLAGSRVSVAADSGAILLPGENKVVYLGPTSTVAAALGDARSATSSVWYRVPATSAWQVWAPNAPALATAGRELVYLTEGESYLVVATEATEWETARPAPVSVRFTDVSADAGLGHLQRVLSPGAPCIVGLCEIEHMTGGAAVADYDRDGFVDVYLTRLDAPDVLYRNRGDGTFVEQSALVGLDRLDLRSNGVAWGDVDNDGDPDLYVTTIVDSRFYLLINEGEAGFVEQAASRGAALAAPGARSGFGVSFGDYDRDGWLDIHVNEWRRALVDGVAVPSTTRLLRNRGAQAPGFFDDATSSIRLAPGDEWGEYAFASAFADFDRDGWPDLAAVADFGQSRLFWNNGDGSFTGGIPLAAGVNGMGSAIGDVDGDGFLDWFISGIYAPDFDCESAMCQGISGTGNRLYGFGGGREMHDITDSAGVVDGAWGWGSVFLDYDNDGDLDLVETNGFAHPIFAATFDLSPMRLWENDGTGVMTERAAEAGIDALADGRGLLTFDYDRDGDLDLLVVTNAGSPLLFRNDGANANSWLGVRVVGTTSNADGIGARITVTATANAAPQVREVGARSHFLGQSELAEHFGLGPDVSSVDEVRIEWPASGRVDVLRDVPTNRRIVVREGRGTFSVE